MGSLWKKGAVAAMGDGDGPASIPRPATHQSRRRRLRRPRSLPGVDDGDERHSKPVDESAKRRRLELKDAVRTHFHMLLFFRLYAPTLEPNSSILLDRCK